jgi:hypothetical protein
MKTIFGGFAAHGNASTKTKAAKHNIVIRKPKAADSFHAILDQYPDHMTSGLMTNLFTAKDD